MKTLAEAIAAHPFVAGMSVAHLQVLGGCAMQTEFAEGELLFRAGDLANRFYLIEAGRVALETTANGGSAVLVETVTAGDVLGWSWLFAPYCWHFGARAVEPTRAIFFYGTRLRAECEDDRELGYEVVRRMAVVAIERLQAAREQLARFYRTRERGPG